MEFVAEAMVAGRFRLERELGHGGMGSVWLAQDTSLDTPCAIKFIHGQAAEDAGMRARFEREAKSAAQLRSPNVVQILDHGVSDGTPYIAMELLEGEDLDHRLRRVGRLSPQEAVYVISQVGKALTRATAAGLVHRDLKPANIFLVRDEDRDIPKVLDFGVAKSTMHEVADSSTKTGALMGTPFYMSPEQTRGTKAIDHRADLWALGVIVFQCITGRLPFLSDALGDLLFKIATDPIPMPSQVAPDLPPSFDVWWTKASQRDPAQRFQTAKEFVDALAMAFGLTQSAGMSQSGGFVHGPVAPGGPYATPNGLSGGSSSGWGASQSGAVAHAASHGPVTQTGVTASAAQAQKRGVGLAVGVIGGAVVIGVLVAVVAFRFSIPPPAAGAVVSATTEVSAPVASAKPSSTTIVTPSATATVTPSATAPPSASATALPSAPPIGGPYARRPHTPPAKTAKPVATAAAHPPPTGKPFPNDGI